LFVFVLIEKANELDTQLPIEPWSKIAGNLVIAKDGGADSVIFVVVDDFVVNEENTCKLSCGLARNLKSLGSKL
jgi:hypothetical protein